MISCIGFPVDFTTLLFLKLYTTVIIFVLYCIFVYFTVDKPQQLR